MKKEEITALIYGIIDEINTKLPKKKQLAKHPEESLFGQEGKLDSLGLVNMIVAVEERLDEEFGLAITIADEKAMSMHNSPFRTVGSLIDYIVQILEEVNE